MPTKYQYPPALISASPLPTALVASSSGRWSVVGNLSFHSVLFRYCSTFFVPIPLALMPNQYAYASPIPKKLLQTLYTYYNLGSVHTYKQQEPDFICEPFVGMPSMTYTQIPLCACSVPCWVLQYALSRSFARSYCSTYHQCHYSLAHSFGTRSHIICARGRSFAFYRLTLSIGSEIFNTSKIACK